MLRAALIAIAFLLGCGSATAEIWPARPLRLVVPFPAGGSTDIIARILADKLVIELGQPVLTDNRGGAAGTIGAEHVARSAPDGYTLLFGSPPDQVTTLFLRGSLAYDPQKDFAPVVLLVRGANVLTVHPSLPVQTVQDLVKLAREKPGTLTFGSAGIGNTSHLSGELLKAEAGIQMLHVPYRGNAPAMNDVVAGHIHALFQSPLQAVKLIEEGKLRALAVTADRRNPTLPQVPTFAEAGLPGVQVYAFYCILAPAGAPAEVVTRLNTAFNGILRQPDVVARLQELGFEMMGGSPADLTAFLGAERVRWGRVIRDAGIKE